MVLAAGRGERMRPLTDTTPKPLLAVQGKPLIEWTLEGMARGGVRQVLVNTAWLGDQLPQRLGEALQPPTGAEPAPLRIAYSHEGRDFGGALETAGGIARALPQLAPVFWIAAGDVFAPDFSFDADALARFAASDHLAHIWLVPNPPHNPKGDFGLLPNGTALAHPPSGSPGYTYSTIGLFRAELFEAPWCDIAKGNPQGIRLGLAPVLRAAMAAGRVSAQHYEGRWTDVGTPQRLAALNGP